jgi:hypothetical protein
MSKKSHFALCIALVGLIVASFMVFAPRPVKAVMAALVRDVDNPARQPFAARCINTTLTEDSQCRISVPAGQAVVIQSVSADTEADRMNSVAVIDLFTMVGGRQFNEAYALFPARLNFNGTQYLSYDARNLTLSADGGTDIICDAETSLPNPAGLTIRCSVSGYYVTLP